MKNGISIGIAVGMIIGAFVVNNCSGVRCLVDETQKKVKSKMQKAASGVVMNNCECACDGDMSTIPDGQSDYMTSDSMMTE